MNNPMDLSGHFYIVTGASQGLGRQVCVTLSQLGARVVLIARNEEKLKETLEQMEPNEHLLYPLDMNDVESIEGCVKEIVAKGGKLDGFVHCAGIGTVRPLGFTKYEFMQEMMRIHLYSFVEFVRVLSKKQNCNPGGSIVAVSTAGTRHSDKGKVAYAATKGALDAVVLPLAIELGESKGIRVNTVNPGWIKTDMYYGYIEEFGEEKMREIEDKHFLGAAEPEEVSNVIAFLLSDASKKITGQSIFVDGGWTIW